MATNDMIVEGVAGRYASALFDLANESSKVSDIESDLVNFQGLLDESPDLLRLVRSRSSEWTIRAGLSPPFSTEQVSAA